MSINSVVYSRLSTTHIIRELVHAGCNVTPRALRCPDALDFARIVRGQNHFTPARVCFVRLKANPNLLVEVTLGEFMYEPIIGVTVVNTVQKKEISTLSSAVFSLSELTDRFEYLESVANEDHTTATAA